MGGTAGVVLFLQLCFVTVASVKAETNSNGIQPIEDNRAKRAAKSQLSTGCAKFSKGPAYYTLDANHGTWPANGFCRYLEPDKTVGDYQITVDLYNKIGWKGVHSGHLGIAYNAKDENNFDFVYFRPHSTGGCFQTGYVLKGILKWDGGISSSCPSGPPKGQVWFNVKVVVRGFSANIYLDGKHVRSLTAKFSAKKRGGVIVANGYKNIIYFKNYRLKAIPTLPFTEKSCLEAKKVANYYVLDANHGKWPANGFCRALLPTNVNSNNYEVSAQLYNQIGWNGVNSGHLGLMYNAIDNNNFDFVYFRPHSTGGCFQTGYVLKGSLKWDGGISSSCPNGPPKGGVWFTVKVVVRGSSASIYLDREHVRSFKAHFLASGRGGVIVANGYKNIIYFKNYRLRVLPPLPFTEESCLAARKVGNYYVLNANHGKWPANGFCRALVPTIVISNNYEVSAQLYNQIGWNGVNSGHLGLMYNAIDNNNFDFVYFRPHSTGGCFQTGYVLKGSLKWDGGISSKCPKGPPKGGIWFTVKVVVRGSLLATIYLDEEPVRSLKAHFASRGRGGVIVANGYKNIIHFKKYRLRAIPPLPFIEKSCLAAKKVGNYYVLNANHGKWPANGFCRALLPTVVNSNNYEVSAQLYNQIGWKGINSGHLGLMYNVIDNNNFDFVYFRPHSTGGCFQTGYVLKGSLKWDGGISSNCPNGPPKGGVWFTVKVVVRGSSASIYLRGEHVRSFKAHFSAKGLGGVIVANGYKNIIHFKKYRLKAIPALPFIEESCLAARKVGNYYVLNANHGKWPANGFCRALLPTIVKSDNYEVSVQLYNQIGWKGVNSGHLGLMYNAIDNNNFDFVYFRPHSTGGCFQTGYVLKGSLKWEGGISSNCPSGPPKGGAWFDVKVIVRGSSASIYLRGKHVRSFKPHFAAKGRGGVIVANGYKNIIHFKNYRLRAIPPLPFIEESCLAARKVGTYYVLNANHGKWPANGFCRALLPTIVNSNNYEMSAQLYNQIGWNGINSGHLGLMYNVIDNNNFDFVYFRPHSTAGCFQTGYVLKGSLKWDGGISSKCPKGPPKGGIWFTVKVVVRGSSATIYLDGKPVRSVKAHFAARGRGGVIVANGYKNIIQFRKYRLKAIPALPFIEESCLAARKVGSYYILNANHGKWPANGFCRALLPTIVKLDNYEVSARLYNQIGWKGVNSGHLGLMYNVLDNNNFDFVYFRPHSTGGCFQTGYVLKGSLKWDGGISSNCPNGPPKGSVWFTVKVVVRGSSASIYLDGKHVRSFKAHFLARGHGGVIVANGYQNIIYFKNYRLRAIPPLPFFEESCLAARKVGNYYVLNANHGKWPANGFCRALVPTIVISNNYEVSAQLYNQIGWQGVNSGHLGLMYNVIDNNNFDFVYFRPHSTGGCFQTGYVLKGSLKWDGGISSNCPNGPPKGGVWFTVKVVVRGSSASIYLRGEHVRSFKAHFSANLLGGVIVANGYKNIIRFKKYRLKGIPALPFTEESCLAARKVGNYYVLNANHGKWPANGFCRALLPTIVKSDNYEVSAQLYNKIGWNGVNSGHLGLMYNVLDNNNFDFVYFRPHSTGGCFQTGYVLKGSLKWDGGISSNCPRGPPKGGVWFTVKVVVRGSSASIYLDGEYVRSFKAHFLARGRGGVIVANGYQNVIQFRKYHLRTIPALPFVQESCLAARKVGNYYVLNANHGKWPANGFCRAIFPTKVSGPRYTVSAKLYNAHGWNGKNSGHLGLMYNVKDNRNFDFVYFRPHSTSGCFQTGYVFNGQLKWDGGKSSSCSNGPPVGGKWFDAKVVMDGSKAKIYRDNTLVTSVTPHFSAKGHGGVCVANGYSNIVHFKKFRIY